MRCVVCGVRRDESAFSDDELMIVIILLRNIFISIMNGRE